MVSLIDFSVLLPVKNQLDKIEASINSVLQQSVPPAEVVIVDDGSTDGTYNFVSKIASKYESIRVVKNNGSGLVDALNCGLREITSEVVMRMDSDDVAYPVRFENNLMKLQEGYIAVSSDWIFTNREGDQRIVYSPVLHNSIILSLVRRNRFCHPGSAFFRTAALEAGGYRYSEFPVEDVGLWLRMAQFGKFATTPETLISMSHSHSSVSSKNRALQISASRKLAMPRITSELFENVFEEMESLDLYPNARIRKEICALEIWDYLLHSKQFTPRKAWRYLPMALRDYVRNVASADGLIHSKVKVSVSDEYK